MGSQHAGISAGCVCLQDTHDDLPSHPHQGDNLLLGHTSIPRLCPEDGQAFVCGMEEGSPQLMTIYGDETWFV